MEQCPTCGAPILAPNQVSISIETGDPHACMADAVEREAARGLEMARRLRAQLLGQGDAETDAAASAWAVELDALTTVPDEWLGCDDQ